MKMRIVLLALISFCFLSVNAADKKKNQPVNDRTQWVDLCYKIAQPVLENMSKGELQKEYATGVESYVGRKRQAGGLYGSIRSAHGRHFSLAGAA